MKRTAAIITLTLLSVLIFAQEDPDGFYAMVQLGAGVISTTENQEAPLTGIFDNDPRNPKIDSLDRQEELRVMPVPYLNGVLGYHFSDFDLSIETAPSTFMGNPGISLVKSLKKVGNLRGTLTYAQKDVWENPYQLAVDRRITDETRWGFGAGWEMIMGLPVSLTYTGTLIDVKEDTAAGAEPQLDRDGEDHRIAVSGIIPVSQQLMFFPEVSYSLRDREGAAEKADGIGGSLAAMINFGSFNTMTAVAYQHTDFDTAHPVWNKQREDHTLSCTQMITFPALAGNERLSLFIMGVWEERFSTIEFFDYRSFVVGSGIEYLF